MAIGYQRFKEILAGILILSSCVNIYLSIIYLPQTKNSLTLWIALFFLAILFLVLFRKQRKYKKARKKR